MEPKHRRAGLRRVFVRHFNERQYHARKAAAPPVLKFGPSIARLFAAGESDEIPYFRFIDNVQPSPGWMRWWSS